jgi:hypothetical protein
MLIRVVLVLVAMSGILSACDCVELSPKTASHDAEIVFRGTITGFREDGHDLRYAVFRVSRVWKGRVNPEFEMLAFEGDSCHAFRLHQLEVGKELLVFGARIPGSSDTHYLPLPCNTSLVGEAPRIKELGRGWKPK